MDVNNWYEEPKLRLLFMRWTELVNSIGVSVDEDTWLQFMDHLTQVDRLADYCKRCRKDYPEQGYDVYSPHVVTADGVCRYECVNGHVWTTYYHAARGLNLPKVSA